MALAVPETWQQRPAVDATELVDPVESARVAGLRYVSDQSPGIRRKRVGKAFSYLASDGHTIRDAENHPPDQAPRHPAGLDRRLDLSGSPRTPAGDRARRAGTKAVSLSPSLAR